MTNKSNKSSPPKTEHTQPNGQTFYTYANQKDICVKKPGARSPFFLVEEKCLWYAMKNLTNGGLKLWCYLSSNRNNYNFALSHKAVGRTTGMSKGTYDNAIKELIDKEYLIRYKDTNHYYFVTDPTLRGGMEKDDYFEWCDKTSKGDYQWSDDDYSDYNESDYENDDCWWKSSKFEYND